MNKTAVILGVGLGLGVLALAGFVWGASEEMLRAIPSDKRRDVLRHMARMRSVGAGTEPGAPAADRTVAVEYRATTPSDWSESILSWVERMNEAGYSIAYWEAEDPSKTTVVAFAPDEEKALAAHRYKGPEGHGWVLLLDPKQFTQVMAGDSHEDLLRGTAEVTHLLPGRGTLFDADAVPVSRQSDVDWLGHKVKKAPIRMPIGTADGLIRSEAIPLRTEPVARVSNGARYSMKVATGPYDNEYVLSGVYQGQLAAPSQPGKQEGRLLVDRVVLFKLLDPKYSAQGPNKGLWRLMALPSADVAKHTDDSGVTDWIYDDYWLEEPAWASVDPSSYLVSQEGLSLAAFDPPKKSVVPGTKVYYVLRETNSLGTAIVVGDGFAMASAPSDPAGTVRISTKSVVKSVKGGEDVSLPPIGVIPIENLVDPGQSPSLSGV